MGTVRDHTCTDPSRYGHKPVTVRFAALCHPLFLLLHFSPCRNLLSLMPATATLAATGKNASPTWYWLLHTHMMSPILESWKARPELPPPSSSLQLVSPHLKCATFPSSSAHSSIFLPFRE